MGIGIGVLRCWGLALSGSGATQPFDRDRMAQGRSTARLDLDVRDRKAMTRHGLHLPGCRSCGMRAWGTRGLGICLVSAGGPVHGCRGESDFAFGGHDKFGWEPENLCALRLVVAILVEKLCI